MSSATAVPRGSVSHHDPALTAGLLLAATGLMYLVQILLPAARSGGAAPDAAALALTRSELVDRFQGVTAYLRSPGQGLWTAPDGHVESDDVLMIEVLVPAFDRMWWREYGRQLAARFQQEAIHIRALGAEVPDDE